MWLECSHHQWTARSEMAVELVALSVSKSNLFCSNTQRSVDPFHVFGSVFRTLAVILGSNFFE